MLMIRLRGRLLATKCIPAMSLRRSTRSSTRTAAPSVAPAAAAANEPVIVDDIEIKHLPVETGASKKRRLSTQNHHVAQQKVSKASPLPDARPESNSLPPSPPATQSMPSSHYQFQQITDPTFIAQHCIKDMPGGDCFFVEKMIPEAEANAWYTQLTGLKEWFRPTLTIYGRSVLQSRLICAYSTEPDRTLTYSNATIPLVSPFPPLVDEIGQRVGKMLGGQGEPVQFNHCMLNWYEDGSVHIGKHSDNLENLVIASLSLGAPRTLVLHPRMPHKTKTSQKVDEQGGEALLTKREIRKLPLPNGSLFVMQGRTQEYWKHEIPKETKIKTGRISLTFRQLIDKPEKKPAVKANRKAAASTRDGEA